MKIVEIGDKDYNLPEGWHEISVKKFERIAKHSSLLNEYKSQTLFTLELISIILDAPLDDIKKLDREAFSFLNKSLDFMNTEITWSGKKEYEIDGEIYLILEDLNKLTMGDSISLEIMLQDSKPEETLINILPILVRKAKVVEKKGEKIYKASEFNADEYGELKELYNEKLMIADVIKVKDFF